MSVGGVGLGGKVRGIRAVRASSGLHSREAMPARYVRYAHVRSSSECDGRDGQTWRKPPDRSTTSLGVPAYSDEHSRE